MGQNPCNHPKGHRHQYAPTPIPHKTEGGEREYSTESYFSYLGDLVPLPPLRVTQEQPAYFPFRDPPPCVARDGDWPTFIHHGSPEVYGLTDPCGEVKVGLHGTGPECDPDRRSFVPEPAGLAELQEYVATWLPGLDAQRPTPISCTYTSTVDASFVLERHGPVVVGAGFSGRGFKHAPEVGRILADLATERAEVTA